MRKPSLVNRFEQELIEDIAGFQHDPHGFVLYAFPWGEGELSKHKGPRPWQIDVLKSIGERLSRGEITSYEAVQEAVQEAVASGHGIGKSALVSWLILWALSTFEDTKGVVTANTENQLKTKTWAEVAKWYRLLINKHWFTLTATALFSVDPEHEKTWRIDMVPWSERNTEAFAGLHNQGKRILLVFDEASAIPDLIWEVSEGALTDEETEIIWVAFGNPTRSSGRFRECFGRYRHRWNTRNIDSRTVEGTNKTQLDKWVEDYGEDSDFVRVRVRGLFPATGSNALVGDEDVRQCMSRHLRPDVYQHAGRVLGVDTARFGDDRTVIFPRQGLAAFKPVIMRGADSTEVAARVAVAIEKFKPDTVFIDNAPIGAGVIDILRRSGHSIIAVDFGGRPSSARFKNKRTEMWWLMAEWIRNGAALPFDSELLLELTEPVYWFSNDKFELEKKDDLKERLGSSPDLADALALTFAMPVAPSHDAAGRPNDRAHRSDYDPYSSA